MDYIKFGEGCKAIIDALTGFLDFRYVAPLLNESASKATVVGN